MRKLPVYLTIGFVLLFIFSSCKRNDIEMPQEESVFSIKQAKDWFTSTLQPTLKTPTSTVTSRLIDNLPPNNKTLLWKFAIQKKNNEVEAVELPYAGTTVVYELPDSSYTTNQQKTAMVQGTAKRAVIYKKPNGTIELMLVHIVPSYEYAAAHPNHFKENYFLNLASDFTGWIYTYDWNDNPKSISEVKNGDLIWGKTRFIQQATSDSTNNRWVPSCYNVCTTVWIGTVGANCGHPGDPYYEDCIYNSQASQGGWTLYCRPECGLVWVPDPWTDNPGDTGGGTPPDDCNYYGTCDNNDETGETALNNFLNSITPTSELVSENETLSGPLEREKEYVWIFAKGIGLSNLIYQSWEKGVHKKVNNEWVWKSLVHNFITKEGTVVGGILDVTVNKADTYSGKYNAGVNLNFTISGSIVWRGSPINGSVTKTSYKTFHVNNDYSPTE